MKILSLILLVCLTISCSENENSSKKGNTAGVTPQGTMPTNGSYNTCDHQNVIYGSFAYSVGDYNIKLMWNKYNDTHHSKYNQIIVKDRHGNMYTSPLITNNTFTIHHDAVDVHGNRLRDHMYLQPGQWYWVDIYSYDSNRKPSYGHEYQHIKRGKDIQLNYGDRQIEAGFCSFKPYGF